MKAMQFRALVALVAMIAAFCGINAEAQTVVTGFNTQDLQSCGEYLINHPADTIVSQATNNEGNLVVTKVFFENGIVSPETLVVKNTTHVNQTRRVTDKASLAAADSSAVRLQTHLLLSDDTAVDKFTHDVYYVVGDSIRPIPVGWAKKYGFHIFATVGWGGNKDVNGFVGGLGVRYDRRWWRVDLEGQVAKSRLSSVAEHAGECYWVYRTQATLGIRPLQLDKNDINRLFLYGGLGFEFYKTDSRTDEYGRNYKSWGNYLYGVVGVAWQHRFFGTGQSLEFGFEYHTSGAVRQNDSFENNGTFVGKVTYTFNAFSNKANYKVKAQ